MTSGGWVGWVMLAYPGNNTYTRVLGFLSDIANDCKRGNDKTEQFVLSPPPSHM